MTVALRLPLVAALCLTVGACSMVTDLSHTEHEQELFGATEESGKPFTAFLDTAFEREAEMRPQWKTQLGIAGSNDRWDEVGDGARDARLALATENLETLETFKREDLSATDQLDYDVFQYREQRVVAMDRWRGLQYPIEQFYGAHTQLPAFLINIHLVKTEKDADDYIARLETIDKPLDQTVAEIEEKAAKGVFIPAFMVPQISTAARNVITGAPFGPGPDSPLLEDIKRKVTALVIPQDAKNEYIARAETAMRDVMKPAYERLIAAVDALKGKATKNEGVHVLDSTGAYYRALLEEITTVDIDPEEVHAIGLRETKRIHAEMNAIRKKVKFKGDLKAFFEYLRTNKRFYYPETPDGREAYLAESRKAIEAMQAKLPELFIRLPKAPIEVRAVEKFREDTAAKAFYSRATPDGSRPAIFYANTRNMRDLPRFEIEALTFHEAVPGHHLQISIASELENVPRIRKFTSYTAYSEGWGLYSEQLGKEVGFYKDPYSDAGRLALELWRAARLVVDSGIHAKGWSHEQATQWLIDNTPNDAEGARKAIDRYYAIPGQATAYMIGQLKILELRDRAKKALGKAFDIREFHDVVLGSGGVPLPILERMVNDYLVRKVAENLATGSRTVDVYYPAEKSPEEEAAMAKRVAAEIVNQLTK